MQDLGTMKANQEKPLKNKVSSQHESPDTSKGESEEKKGMTLKNLLTYKFLWLFVMTVVNYCDCVAFNF